MSDLFIKTIFIFLFTILICDCSDKIITQNKDISFDIDYSRLDNEEYNKLKLYESFNSNKPSILFLKQVHEARPSFFTLSKSDWIQARYKSPYEYKKNLNLIEITIMSQLKILRILSCLSNKEIPIFAEGLNDLIVPIKLNGTFYENYGGDDGVKYICGSKSKCKDIILDVNNHFKEFNYKSTVQDLTQEQKEMLYYFGAERIALMIDLIKNVRGTEYKSTTKKIK